MKSSLQKVIGNDKLKFDELNTILIEVESMLKSLTNLSEKYYDVAITLHHVMYGRNILNDNSKQDLVTNVTVKEVQNGIKNAETALQNFQNSFYAEYKTTLRERSLYN